MSSPLSLPKGGVQGDLQMGCHWGCGAPVVGTNQLPLSAFSSPKSPNQPFQGKREFIPKPMKPLADGDSSPLTVKIVCAFLCAPAFNQVLAESSDLTLLPFQLLNCRRRMSHHGNLGPHPDSTHLTPLPLLCYQDEERE